uniref:Uncharacterized protein n=1 Tax=Globisporangium ultimum (strain ATCC 200006 / CBS 805.95 / DAOM BR144) TaxID=431595 RepID=K3X7V1_GLOUD
MAPAKPKEQLTGQSGELYPSVWTAMWRALSSMNNTKIVPVVSAPQPRGPQSVPRRQKLATHRNPNSTNVQERSAFEYLGPPLVLVICVSILWTTGLMVLNLALNYTANYLMDTAEFDDGAFWLIIDQTLPLRIATVFGLLLIILGYCFVLLKMTVLRNRESRLAASLSKLTRAIFRDSSSRQRFLQSWKKLTEYQGANRKRWTMALCQILEDGFPEVLAYTYAVLIATNAMSCVLAILNHSRISAFGEVLIDTMFDMVMVVGTPVILLLYSYSNFHFDREVCRINLEMIPTGAFERQVRLAADPIQVTLFLRCFNGLRVWGIVDYVLRIGMNLSFCYRLKRVVEIKIQQRRRDSAAHGGVVDNALHHHQKPVLKWMAV